MESRSNLVGRWLIAVNTAIAVSEASTEILLASRRLCAEARVMRAKSRSERGRR